MRLQYVGGQCHIWLPQDAGEENTIIGIIATPSRTISMNTTTSISTRISTTTATSISITTRYCCRCYTEANGPGGHGSLDHPAVARLGLQNARVGLLVK